MADLVMNSPDTTHSTGTSGKSYWSGKRVFITGHTGFKGCWLVAWLHHCGARVKGYALPPETDPDLFSALDIAGLCDSVFGDIRDKSTLQAELTDFSPEVIFHLAAQPLVRKSYEQPIETFDINVMGTINLLECSRQLPYLQTILVVTTDKVYQNNEWLWPYRESDPLGGHDPYSASKAATEMVVQSWKKSFFDPDGQVRLATARAGNIIGGGDWNVDRLLPDCIRAIQTGSRLTVRSPQAVRPWQHVADAINGYLLLAEKMSDKGCPLPDTFNFGPPGDGLVSVAEIVGLVNAHSRKNLNYEFAEDAAAPHEAGLLALDSSQARTLLGWRSEYSASETVKATLEWYDFYDRAPISTALLDYTIEQMQAREQLLFTI
jgi:CDP-glucose 4,6-dehydratase